MKRLTVIFCSTIVLATIGCNDAGTGTGTKSDTTTAAKDTTTTAETPAPPPDSAAMMKAWTEYMTPGEPHKVMASQNGKWEGKITMWMAPGAPPSESKGTCVNQMIMGGRYQEGKFAGDFNGMPFEGRSIMGYDNTRKVFISTWIDNMGTGVMTTEGPWDPATKTISLTGKMIDPMTGKECQVREVMTLIDDKSSKMEMYNTPAGQKEFKSMEILYTKK
ncbi:DUF1579 domain-containing protein [Paraflavitalea speifideaquila]|uniref:DUF1579 domain-containing protein n=1 Tax=Paraflavitalea speifideaquila TaxID=3076558 RepID=UPI0028E70538|nr:DUF1579 domain-containing protein [Paraflavitalea speifideiaquila]